MIYSNGRRTGFGNGLCKADWWRKSDTNELFLDDGWIEALDLVLGYLSSGRDLRNLFAAAGLRNT